MREFIRLQLKLKWGLNRNNKKTSAIMTSVAALLAVAVVLALVYVLSFALKATTLSPAPKQLAQLYLAIILVGLTVAATGMQIKRLYRPADILITARFPISPFKLFLSYLILNYIDLSVYSAVLCLPVMLVYGFAMGCMGFTYVMGVLLGAIFMPIVPFALSVFIAVPVVYLTSLLEKYGVARLVLFAVVLVGCFVLYDYILTALAQFFIHGKNWEAGTLEIWGKILSALDAYYDPAYYLGNMIFFDRFWLGFGVILGAGAALIAGGAAMAYAVCGKLRAKALENGFGGYARRTSIDGYGSSRAIFRYGFKEIMRTKTYSYFYFGVAISTPVMVFFCDRLVKIVGEAYVGVGLNFGASMLVISVFMAMICSFTGSVLSMEGKNFYITKLVPVEYRTQLLVKAFLNIGVGAVALLISAAVLGFLHFVNAVEMTVLIVTEVLLIVGFVFNGINLNLANPNLRPKANGEADEINITYMLMIGLVVAACIGASSIIFPRAEGIGATWAYVAAVGIGLVYAAINFVIFWFTADKKYRKIEI